MSARAIVLCLATALLTGAACGTDPIQSTEPPSFAADPDQVLASDSGGLMIAVRFAPPLPPSGPTPFSCRSWIRTAPPRPASP